MALFKHIRDLLSGSTPTSDAGECPADQGASPFGRGRPRRYDPFTDTGTPPPDVPGVYRFIDENGEIQYIGETGSIPRRLSQHKRDGNISPGERIDYKIAREGSTSEERRVVERKKIEQHNPPRNKKAGGGRRAQ